VAVADAPPGAVVVHCQAGKDRTGLVIALILSALGVLDERSPRTTPSVPSGSTRTTGRSETGSTIPNDWNFSTNYTTPARTHARDVGARTSPVRGAEQYLCHDGLTRRQVQALHTRLLDEELHCLAPELGRC
jgi:hypothetical protein